jgi:hypothetical protein
MIKAVRSQNYLIKHFNNIANEMKNIELLLLILTDEIQ